MLEQIPNLERERKRLRKSRNQIMDKFEQYKLKRIELEKTIIQQKEDIRNSERVFEEHRRLEERIQELKRKLDENTSAMGQGDHSVANVAKFVMGDLARAGYLGGGNNGGDDDSDYDPMATPRSDRDPPSRGSPRHSPHGSPRHSGYDSPRETRGRSPSPMRSDSPHYETR